MEWGILTNVEEFYIAGGIIVLFVAGIFTLCAAIAVHTSKNKDDRQSTSAVCVLAVLSLAAGSSLLGVGMVKATAGESLNQLPEGKYVYDVAFVNHARGDSYYLVVRSQPTMKDDPPRVQRSVELVHGTHVNVNGVPANGKFPAPVLRNGELMVTKAKNPPYEWKVYNLFFKTD